jgi:hypothetical protein
MVYKLFSGLKLLFLWPAAELRVGGDGGCEFRRADQK